MQASAYMSASRTKIHFSPCRSFFCYSNAFDTKPGRIHLLQQTISKEVDRLVSASPSFKLCHGEGGVSLQLCRGEGRTSLRMCHREVGLDCDCVAERDGLVSDCIMERDTLQKKTKRLLQPTWVISVASSLSSNVHTSRSINQVSNFYTSSAMVIM